MSWTANITLKSGKCIVVEDLNFIKQASFFDTDIEKITDFKEFYLSSSTNLSFVGTNKVVTLKSDEIEYVDLSSTN